jgi:peptidoglycan/xylan/chitin deacetylase (PgdA/CDA1 family)
LRQIFQTNEKVEIEVLNKIFLCADKASRISNLSNATLLLLRDHRLIADLRCTFSRYGVSLAALCDKYFINTDELRTLARDPLASIGAHSVTHRALASLDTAEAKGEFVDNRAFLESCIDMRVQDFAYPFGSAHTCGPREADLAREVGFRSATTTANRPLVAQDGRDVYYLPRVSIHPHWTKAHLDAEVSGFTLAALRHNLQLTQKNARSS